ncbi:bifunctional nicotinamidase/pyrazinamidase [Acinetobacter junii]|jgi:nicotinamidase/pyrazinamidase|uniref:bifunctional nicotinamidase/pyrazinamidase n=1 Tax=Acinetobacter junii TaxID=40215 RepID=UPI00124D0EEC|nr:bifunctional nicotinamidase/pyrazinamidase [Acinetobacter junii]MDH0666666.1 bifunctional nicotinamidase/pyrazinamidase [Acinetobacter junii]MDH0718749.1 bifunctional nicotinamidase/pyrazinamidase [Acinetobacter junii]MDH1859830.1 bifunctional nicotinamidase/pyrazinamidase [Acinetobacter junii]USR73348.1 bifunctional nicotinamidase/pyrazinamidase [Acinetobacter junii]WRL35151.1 bifunctional nicotinamidase/pyrazinamidase [Acinetobacter junii]
MLKQVKQTVLIVVDVQNGFTPGGNLAVANADEIIPNINQLAQKFEHIVLTQDWHPDQHISFADNHPNKKPFETIELDYGRQVLWPKHCVQGTRDAEFHPHLNIPTAQLIIRKGCHQNIDSYSAFMEADRKTPTGLNGYLREHQINTVFIVGIATDFCVAWTAIDAAELGFDTYVIEDACKAIDLNGSLQQAWQDMSQKGVHRIEASSILL